MNLHSIVRQNVKELDAYYERLNKGLFPIEKSCHLTAADALRRRVIMRLMCDMHLDFDEQSEALGIDFRETFAESLAELTPLRDDGLVELENDSLRVTRVGRLLIRNIASRFDAYLKADARGYSKAV